MNAKEDGREDNVDFQDQNLAFNKELEKVGVVARELKRPIKKRVFQCWLSKEEKEWRKKKDAVHKAKLLKKFGGVNFYDLEVMYTVHTTQVTWSGRNGMGVWRLA